MSLDPLAANFRALGRRLEQACAAAGRSREALQLVAVTKSVAPAMAEALHRLGQRDFGENRLEALEAKRLWFRERGLEARWHWIGHLQRNKLRRALALTDTLHACDRLELVEALVRCAASIERPLSLYLQVKLWPEESKGGLAEHELGAALDLLAGAPQLELRGLMTMAPLLDDPQAAREAARAVFRRAAQLARTLPSERFAEGRAQLSMGMSSDFEEAVLAGSDCVRIGSELFRGVERL